MEVVDTEQSLREIAIQYPESILVFEKYNLDYACRSELKLVDVCQKAGVSASSVGSEIEGLIFNESNINFPEHVENWTTIAIIKFITSHYHSYIKKSLPEIFTLLENSKKETNDSIIIREVIQLFSWITREIVVHISEEEKDIFPHIEQIASDADVGVDYHDSITNSAKMVKLESQDLEDAFSEIRLVASNRGLYESESESLKRALNGILELEQKVLYYFHLENNILFPRAVELEAKF